MDASHNVLRNVHSGLVVNSVDGHLIKFRSQESQLGTDLFGGFTSILGLEARKPELEVEAESEVKLECVEVHGPTC